MFVLYMINGPLSGHSFEIDQNEIFVGRAPDNPIQIVEQSISRRHARIFRTSDRYFIEDLQSQNGTYLNGHPISPGFQLELKEGDFIALGNILMSVGPPYADDGMVTQYSISLLDQPEEIRENALYRDRRITDRDKLEKIYEISTLLMQSLEIEEIAEKMIDSIFSCLESIDSAALLLVDPQTKEYNQVAAHSRDSMQDMQMSHSRTIVQRVMNEGKAVMMSDTSLAKEGDLSQSMIRLRIKSVMCVPLVSKSQVYGVIYVHSTKMPFGFMRSDLSLLTAMSTPAALAIENALFYAKRKKAEEDLQKAHGELEIRVQERTDELSKTNERLKQEIAVRTEAEKNLRALHEKLKEANRNLEIAYARMRDSKDRLSSHLFEEDIAFLIDESGKIQAMTQKALEISEKSRFDLFGSTIGDLLDEPSAKALEQDISNARKGIFEQTVLQLKKKHTLDQKVRAKILPLRFKAGTMLLVLIRRTQKEEQT
jgi:pSer/pThr/pTyr-binding forkhead associated (FHA) protein/PAS domain-containing protein